MRAIVRDRGGPALALSPEVPAKEQRIMDRNGVVIGAVVLGVVAIVGGMVYSGERDKLRSQKEPDRKEVVAMAMAAKVTIDQAIKTALENFPGKVIEAELEKNHSTTLWRIDILTAEQGIMVVLVDAESGSVITTGERMDGRNHAPEKKT
jgi:uncharacterized membrane protein YkoI